MTNEDKEWLGQLAAALRQNLDTSLGRQTVERLWHGRLLNDSEAELLLGVLLYEQLSEKQLITVHSIKFRLLRRIGNAATNPKPEA